MQGCSCSYTMFTAQCECEGGKAVFLPLSLWRRSMPGKGFASGCKKNLHPAGSIFLRRPCQPPRYGAWNRRQHAQSVVTRGFPCAAPDPLFSAVRCAHLFRGAQPPLLSRRAAVSPRWWRQAKRQGRCCFYSKVIRRICLCHLTARRPHAALDASVFCQRKTVIKRDCL